MKVIKITVEMTEDEYEEFKDAKEGFLNLNIESFLEKAGYEQCDATNVTINKIRFFKNKFGDYVALGEEGLS